MSSGLHINIVKVAGDSIAFAIADTVLNRLVLNSVRAAARAQAGQSVSSGLTGVDCRLTSMSVDPTNLKCELRQAASNIFVDVTPNVDFTVSLHVSGDSALAFSEIQYSVADLSLGVLGGPNSILLEAPTFSVAGTITNAATRAAALAAFAGSELDVQRLEGGMAFLFAHRLVGATFGSGFTIPLSDCFPSITMAGNPSLYVFYTASRSYLVIVPAAASIEENKECPTEQPVPPVLTPSTPTRTGSDGATWDISVGAIPPPPATVISSDDPEIGVYLPKAVLGVRFANVFPAIAVHYQDPGFVGWTLNATARVERFSLAIDSARAGLDITLSTPVDGSVQVNVDVPCVGRVPVAYTAVCEINTCDIQLLLRPGFADGKLSLRSDIDAVTIGKCTVIVVALAAYLAYAGGYAAVIGLILDGIIDAVLMHNLPIELRHGISKALDNTTVPLLDVGAIIPTATPYTFPTFDDTANSVLLGVVFNRG